MNQIVSDNLKINIYKEQVEQYMKVTKKMKAKISDSIRFIALNVSGEKHSKNVIYEVMNENQNLYNKLTQINEENKSLRSMLHINHTYNSYKSIEDGIKKFEKSEENDRQLSPSNEQTHQESKSPVNQFIKSRVS
jgi:hypothetical protein